MSFLRSRRAEHSVLAVFLGALGGCAEPQSDASVQVRDSAGVGIVENRRPAWGVGEGWRLSDEPTLSIGLADGPTEYQFSGIEGVVRLPDGGLVVADGGSREIRFFDASGAYVGASGRRGDAPGEYQQITSLGYGPGDSLWVYDFGNRRFTVLNPAGAVVRTVRLGGELSAVGAVGRLPHGSFVVREYWSKGPRSGQIRFGLSREPAAVVRYSADGGSLDTIGLFPGREVYIGSEDGRAVMSAPLFARSASVALVGNELFVGDQERFEIGRYTASGALRGITRVLDVDLRLTPEDIDRAVAERLAEEPPGRHAMLRAHLDAMDVPETRPAYGRLRVDSEGNLWVSAHALAPAEPTSWDVFDPGGRWLGAVRVPEDLRVHGIGGDWVLGVWRDALGVEYVRMYRLVKNGEIS